MPLLSLACSPFKRPKGVQPLKVFSERQRWQTVVNSDQVNKIKAYKSHFPSCSKICDAFSRSMWCSSMMCIGAPHILSSWPTVTTVVWVPAIAPRMWQPTMSRPSSSWMVAFVDPDPTEMDQPILWTVCLAGKGTGICGLL